MSEAPGPTCRPPAPPGSYLPAAAGGRLDRDAARSPASVGGRRRGMRGRGRGREVLLIVI